MIRLAIFAAIAAVIRLAAGECVPVSGRILGRDLKRASAGFENIDDQTVIALAPAPGAQRLLSPLEAARFGNRTARACFERLTHAITSDDIKAAMHAALAGRDVEIQITDFSRTSIPEGKLEFPLAGLMRPPVSKLDAPVLWHGRVHYDEAKSLPVWATVRLTEVRQWTEAATALTPDKTVESADLRVKSGRLFPLTDVSVVAIDRVIGRKPRRPITAGQIISERMFVEPPAVNKGDALKVVVVSGSVELHFDGQAETSGRVNDRILVFDPAQGRRIKGMVVEKGKVVIDAKEQMGRARPQRGAVADSGRGGVFEEADVKDARAVATRQIPQ